MIRMDRTEYILHKFETSRMNHLFGTMEIGDSWGGIEKFNVQTVRNEAWRWSKKLGQKLSVKKDSDNPGMWKCTRLS